MNIDDILNTNKPAKEPKTVDTVEPIVAFTPEAILSTTDAKLAAVDNKPVSVAKAKTTEKKTSVPDNTSNIMTESVVSLLVSINDKLEKLVALLPNSNRQQEPINKAFERNIPADVPIEKQSINMLGGTKSISQILKGE
jgi:hypothetical protein